MHISEGVLPAPVIVSGWVATSVLAGITLRKIEGEEIPKTAVLTSAFFVASLIHVPMGPFSAHLILNGLVGVILGHAAFPSILLGLTLQALLYQHGGMTVIGVNALIMGLPAMAASGIFRFGRIAARGSGDLAFAFLAGALGAAFSGALLAFFLATSGKAFLPAAKLALAAHVPVMLIEGTITAAAVSFLTRVKPGLLGDRAAPSGDGKEWR